MIAIGFFLAFYFGITAMFWADADYFGFMRSRVADAVVVLATLGFILLGVGITRWLWVHA